MILLFGGTFYTKSKNETVTNTSVYTHCLQERKWKKNDHVTLNFLEELNRCDAHLTKDEKHVIITNTCKHYRHSDCCCNGIYILDLLSKNNYKLRKSKVTLHNNFSARSVVLTKGGKCTKNVVEAYYRQVMTFAPADIVGVIYNYLCVEEELHCIWTNYSHRIHVKPKHERSNYDDKLHHFVIPVSSVLHTT